MAPAVIVIEEQADALRGARDHHVLEGGVGIDDHLAQIPDTGQARARRLLDSLSTVPPADNVYADIAGR
ncbi:hypothetical protein ACL02S_04805 [Nocardia sp. 004]|uniref:hypothetical protein n=1 Tax=Nocardia sp. 004 TaxID=3385978 RepID=UPI0039A36980